MCAAIEFSTRVVRLGRPKAPHRRPVGVQFECMLIDHVIIIEWEPDEIGAADGTGWKLVRGPKLQPNILPDAHRLKLALRYAAFDTQ